MRTFGWRILPLIALLAIIPAATSGVLAQDRGARQQQETPRDGGSVLRLLPQDSVSDKEATFAGHTMAYTATAGTFTLYDQNGERSAASTSAAILIRWSILGSVRHCIRRDPAMRAHFPRQVIR